VNLAAGEMHDLKTICTTIPGPIRRAPKIGVSDLAKFTQYEETISESSRSFAVQRTPSRLSSVWKSRRSSRHG
jgi:hypothetical protein